MTAASSAPVTLTKNEKGIYTNNRQGYEPSPISQGDGQGSNEDNAPRQSSSPESNPAESKKESSPPAQLTQVETRKSGSQPPVEAMNITEPARDQQHDNATPKFAQIETAKQENNGQDRMESNRPAYTNQQTD